MQGILDLLQSQAGREVVAGIAGQTGQSEESTNNVMQMAMPVLMQAMRKNAASPEGAAGLMNALSSKHDGSILDNLGGLFAGGVDDDVVQDGSKILGHVLGSKQGNVENVLGAKTGLDASAVGDMLKVAAPILLGFLGKQKREQNISGADGLESLMGGLLSGNSPQTKENFLNAVLDADGDGSVIDDVAGMLLGGGKKKGGLGGMLGNILGG